MYCGSSKEIASAGSKFVMSEARSSTRALDWMPVSSITLDGTELVLVSYAAGTLISVVINSQSITGVGKKEVILKTAIGTSLKATLLVVSST